MIASKPNVCNRIVTGFALGNYLWYLLELNKHFRTFILYRLSAPHFDFPFGKQHAHNFFSLFFHILSVYGSCQCLAVQHLLCRLHFNVFHKASFFPPSVLILCTKIHLDPSVCMAYKIILYDNPLETWTYIESKCSYTDFHTMLSALIRCFHLTYTHTHIFGIF